MGSAPGQAFPVGWYGKIPATGDFIARHMPPAFSEAWDRWLQAAIAGSRDRLGGEWREAYLSMPAWRFVFSPGMLSPDSWAGLVVPSVDAVGRYFPLAMASALPSTSLDLVHTLLAAQAWFDEIESIALKALAPRPDVAALDAAIVRSPFRAEWLRHAQADDQTVSTRGTKAQMLCVPLAARHAGSDSEMRQLGQRLGQPCGVWLAEESDIFGRCLLLCQALPPAEQYCAMMDGRWVEHDWRLLDVRTGATT